MTETVGWWIGRIDSRSDWLAEWEALNNSQWDTPLLSAVVLEPALKYFGNDSDRLAIGRRGSRIVSMAILRPGMAGDWRVFQPSQLPLPALLLAREESFEKLGRSLLAALPLRVQTLSVTNLDPLLVDRPASEPCIDVLPHMVTGSILFPEHGADYFETRSTSLRQNFARRVRRASEKFGEPHLDVSVDIDDIDSFLELYSSTETSGWKGEIETAIRTDDTQGAFYRAMMRGAAGRGVLRMFTLRFGDLPVAQQIALEDTDVLYFLKTTYDEKYKALSPGVLQRMYVLKWATQNGRSIRRAELYGRLNEWQLPFVTDTREIYHATFYRLAIFRRLKEKLRKIYSTPLAAASSEEKKIVSRTFHSSPQHGKSPFSSPEWFDLLWRTCFRRGGGRIISINGGQKAGGYLPLYFPQGRWGRVISGLSNFYTPLFLPTGDVEQQGAVAVELVRHLRELKGWAELRLQPLEEDAGWINRLSLELKRGGFKYDQYFCFGNWYAEVAGKTAKEFLDETLKPEVRNTIVRAERRLRNRGVYEIELRSGGVDGAVLDECISAFQTVYGHSWKREEPYPDFIPELFRLAARAGWLRFGCLRLDGKPIACQIWLTCEGVASIYKLAYDSEYARFSPGSILSQEMFRHAIDVDRVREIDYLIGDDPYKEAWMTHRRNRVGLVVFNHHHPMGLSRMVAHYAGRIWKRFATHTEAKRNSGYWAL